MLLGGEKGNGKREIDTSTFSRFDSSGNDTMRLCQFDIALCLFISTCLMTSAHG
jgi:hypothetical protein